MNSGMGKIIADGILFGKVSCWTTIIAVAAFFIIWWFPGLKTQFDLPEATLFVLLAVLAAAILVDQINKRHCRPQKIKTIIERYK